MQTWLLWLDRAWVYCANETCLICFYKIIFSNFLRIGRIRIRIDDSCNTYTVTVHVLHKTKNLWFYNLYQPEFRNVSIQAKSHKPLIFSSCKCESNASKLIGSLRVSSNSQHHLHEFLSLAHLRWRWPFFLYRRANLHNPRARRARTVILNLRFPARYEMMEGRGRCSGAINGHFQVDAITGTALSCYYLEKRSRRRAFPPAGRSPGKNRTEDTTGPGEGYTPTRHSNFCLIIYLDRPNRHREKQVIPQTFQVFIENKLQ